MTDTFNDALAASKETGPAHSKTDARTGNRTYQDPTDPKSGDFVSVTTFLNIIDKPGLLPWGSKIIAEFAVNSVDEWAELPSDEAVKLLKAQPIAARDLAAERGTLVHDLLEHDQTCSIDRRFHPEAVGYIDAACQFITEWEPLWVHREVQVFSTEHGYAGTLDFIAFLPGLGLCIGDFKTSTGTYPTNALQLHAYAFADFMIVDGEKVEIPDLDCAVIVHIGDGTYSVKRIELSEETFGMVVAARRLYDFNKAGLRSTTIGAPEVPFTDARRETIRQRIVNMPEDQRGKVAAQWPQGVPTFKGDHPHSHAELDEVEIAIAMALPLGQPTPEGQVAEIAERLGKLPVDILGRLSTLAMSTGMENIARRRPTLGEFQTLQVLTDRAEVEHEERLQVLDFYWASACDETLQSGSINGNELKKAACHLAVGEYNYELADDRETEVIKAIFAGIHRGFLTTDRIDGKPAIRPVATVLDRLVAAVGSKTDINKIAKVAAERHDLPKPRKAADVAACPILSALVAASE